MDHTCKSCKLQMVTAHTNALRTGSGEKFCRRHKNRKVSLGQTPCVETMIATSNSSVRGFRSLFRKRRNIATGAEVTLKLKAIPGAWGISDTTADVAPVGWRRQKSPKAEGRHTISQHLEDTSCGSSFSRKFRSVTCAWLFQRCRAVVGFEFPLVPLMRTNPHYHHALLS